MAKDKRSPGVTIGKITGGIHGSVIAGRDVKDVTITLGGQPTKADKEPDLEELKQLLAEIQAELAEITPRKEALEAVSPAAPFSAQGAEQSVRDAAQKVGSEMNPESAESIQKRLSEAGSLLKGILDGARIVVEKTGEIADAAKPLLEKLGPLVEKVGVAAFWAARLWPLP